MIKKIFLTGAAGFVGSHLSDKLFQNYKKCQFILFDKVTYAANKNFIKNLLKKKNFRFIKNDLLNYKSLETHLKGVDLAINVAAESHVDNSFGNSLLFTKTNTLGTHCFLEACRKQKVKKIIHISTDEVYGENSNKPFKENQILNPTNPYSASKAGADMMVNAYNKSYKLKITTIRANNIYGIRQFPEKLVSKSIFSFLNKKKMTIHGKGKNFRFFLSVEDFCDGVIKIIKKGKNNTIYNIASDKCYSVKQVVKMIAEHMQLDFKKNILFVNDRPFNDKNYRIDCSKLKNLNWRVKKNLKDDIPYLCEWYKKNKILFKI